MCGHIVVYCLSYVPLVLEAGIINPFVAVGLAVAAAITVLLIVLGVTSFGSVKVRMSKQAWVKVQKWAYVFFSLTYAHVLAMLLPSALGGGTAAVQSVAAYTVVFGVYAVLRVARALRESEGAVCQKFRLIASDRFVGQGQSPYPTGRSSGAFAYWDFIYGPLPLSYPRFLGRTLYQKPLP